MSVMYRSICDILALLFATWVYEMRDYSEVSVTVVMAMVMAIGDRVTRVGRYHVVGYRVCCRL